MKRIMLSIPEETWDIVDTAFKGKFGNTDSEIVRNIIVAYLSEQGYFRSPKVRPND
jgi:metal-responsive CopG/Arc/MetJ family transcriptional regulator